MGRDQWKNLEEIYREAREKEGTVIIPPQINYEYNQKLHKIRGDIRELLKECIHYKQKALENPGMEIQGNIILGAPPHYYDPSKEEERLSEIGKAISQIIQGCTTREKCRNMIHEISQGPCIDIIEFTNYNFYHVDVIGSGRFIYPEKGVYIRFSIINEVAQALTLSFSSDDSQSDEERFYELLKLLK
ncbi:MAG: hypothetical protein ACTSQI_19755 [Candidatus Helarchaeota archaeon]